MSSSHISSKPATHAPLPPLCPAHLELDPVLPALSGLLEGGQQRRQVALACYTPPHHLDHHLQAGQEEAKSQSHSEKSE
jgi:hypothetical protein